MATETEERKSLSVSAWGMEAEHPTNSDLLIKCLANVRLRSAVRPVKEVIGRRHGEQITKATSADNIDGLPSRVPGMQLHVNPRTRKVRVIDPLLKEEQTLEDINTAMQEAGIPTATKLRAVPTREELLDEDQFKTLVREMVWFVEAGEAVVARGVKPDLEEVDQLPGDYLLNPGSGSQWNMPRYEKELDEWKKNLNRLGAG